MNKHKITYSYLQNRYFSVFIIISIACLVALFIFLLNNPYVKLHEEVFNLAEKTRNYYRDQPSYWHLSTASATEDKLLENINSLKSDFTTEIGQGENGETGLPGVLTFDIALKHLSKSACISLIETNINNKNRLGLISITISNDSATNEFSWGGKNSLPIEMYKHRDVCDNQENTIIFKFQ